MTYRSPFKRVNVSDIGGKKIKRIQELFDTFWSQIHKYADKSPEKYHAMKCMQEACMWMTRACATQNITEPEVIIDDPLIRTQHQKTIGEALEKYADGDRIKVKNSPTIIFKKKIK